MRASTRVPAWMTAVLVMQLASFCLFLAGCGDKTGEGEGFDLVIDAGLDLTVDELTEVVLTGSAVSGGDRIAAWQWRQVHGTEVELDGADSRSVRFVAPESPRGQVMLFRLTAFDEDGGSASDSVSVTVVRAFNRPPVAHAGFDQEVDVGEIARLGGGASHDPDGEIVAYDWRQIGGPSVHLDDPGQVNVQFEAAEQYAHETLEFELTVTDDDGDTDSDTVRVTISHLMRAPDAPVLVSVTSLGESSAEASWLPVSTETDTGAVVYTVHVSTEPQFLPTGATAYLQVTDASSATLENLTNDTQYYVRVQAHTPGSRYSWSNELGFRTDETPSLPNPDVLYRVLDDGSSTQLRASIDGDVVSWELEADEPAPVPGEILISANTGAPFLRRVVSATVQNTWATAETEPAGMADVFDRFSFSSATKLVNLPETESQGSIQGMLGPDPVIRLGEVGVIWPDSNLVLAQSGGEDAGPHGRSMDELRRSMQEDQAVSDRQLEIRGAAARLTQPGEQLRLTVVAEVDDLDYEVETLELTRIDPPSSSFATPPAGADARIVSAVDSRQEMEFSWRPTLAQADPDGNPYTLVFNATAEQKRNCNPDAWVFNRCASRSVTMQVPIYIGFSEPAPASVFFEASGPNLTFEGSIGVSLEPEIHAGAEIRRGSLQSAELLATASAGIDLHALVQAHGSARAEHSRELFNRRFVKVIPTTVPIVVVGTLTVEAQFEANANAQISVEQDFNYTFDVEAGVRYTAGGGWQPVAQSEQGVSYKILGEGEAAVDVEVRLVPRLRLALYDTLAGYISVEPYLFGEAGLEGRIEYSYDPAVSAFDAAYRFTELDIGGGVDLGLRADFSVWDYTLAGWPSRRSDHFHTMSIIGRTVLYGLADLWLTTSDEGEFTTHVKDNTVFKRNGFVLDSGVWVVHPQSGDDFTVEVDPEGWDGVQDDATQGARICIDAPEELYNAHLWDRPFTVRFAGHAEWGAWLSMYEELQNVLLPRCGDSGDEECVPDCEGRECGPDPECGELCPPGCAEDHYCQAGVCVEGECEPDCEGRECGQDPVCGQSCGTCPPDHECTQDGQCISGGCGPECGEMLPVPAGSFTMGCNEAVDEDCWDTELPPRTVHVSSFEIDKYQVTMEMYESCVSAGACTEPGTDTLFCNARHDDRGEHPVNCIDWHQAQEYCEWAGKRLCSEAEWEKAARGTDGRIYPWGNEPATCERAVMNYEASGCGVNRTWPVGSRPLGASPYGALDMAGNVWEWVEDDWHDSYEGAPSGGGPWIDEPRAPRRVRRGGSFLNNATRMRASNRMDSAPDYARYDRGIRCCR